MTGGCILVVDDEPEIRRLVKEILEDEQYQVVTAEDATTAREAYATERLDLVLLVFEDFLDELAAAHELPFDSQSMKILYPPEKAPAGARGSILYGRSVHDRRMHSRG